MPHLLSWKAVWYGAADDSVLLIHADPMLTDRINKGGTVLDLFSLSCIGIITGHVCGAKYSIPGSNLAPPLAQDSKRMSGNLSVSLVYSSYTPRIYLCIVLP